jgi:hypothetical protein
MNVWLNGASMGTSERSPNDELLQRLRRRKFSHVCAGGADALVAFIRDNAGSPAPVRARISDGAEMRFYPVKGGQIVKWPWKGSSPDPKYFRVAAGGWDHEHCTACNATIKVEVGCWITRRGSFVLLCEACHRRMKRLSAARTRRLTSGKSSRPTRRSA